MSFWLNYSTSSVQQFPVNIYKVFIFQGAAVSSSGGSDNEESDKSENESNSSGSDSSSSSSLGGGSRVPVSRKPGRGNKMFLNS